MLGALKLGFTQADDCFPQQEGDDAHMEVKVWLNWGLDKGQYDDEYDEEDDYFRHR